MRRARLPCGSPGGRSGALAAAGDREDQAPAANQAPATNQGPEPRTARSSKSRMGTSARAKGPKSSKTKAPAKTPPVPRQEPAPPGPDHDRMEGIEGPEPELAEPELAGHSRPSPKPAPEEARGSEPIMDPESPVTWATEEVMAQREVRKPTILTTTPASKPRGRPLKSRSTTTTSEGGLPEPTRQLTRVESAASASRSQSARSTRSGPLATQMSDPERVMRGVSQKRTRNSPGTAGEPPKRILYRETQLDREPLSKQHRELLEQFISDSAWKPEAPESPESPDPLSQEADMNTWEVISELLISCQGRGAPQEETRQ
ncbi:uncharacterized protein BDW47DRAFT_122182 [Aspergillus candidus]|uniref:Uncharacterized protein n=1 Tax=Aspergillus candidus TaxID=41067 RepID=A0A2I2FM72_ASPCN|nr:hypothetical protein BDW47DRAFT_122182 [Aspergillus candidus]PLB41728.1 hypothetical protein BDW47DRAFT_122182 [Aspergillus candidus]